MSPSLETRAKPRSLTPVTTGNRPALDRGRVLVAARWPVGGIRTHLRTNYPDAADGRGVTLVVPDAVSLGNVRDLIDDAEFVGVPLRGRLCRLWPTLRRLLRSGRFTVLHSHGTTAAVEGAFANLGVSVPHVVTLHEPFRSQQFRGMVGQVKRWLLGCVFRQADALITVSDDARDNLLAYFPTLRSRAHRIITIPNGIDTTTGSAPSRWRADLRQQLELSPDTMLLGFLGRFMPEKGFPLLLEAVRKIAVSDSHVRFHLAAFGSGDYRREYQKQIEEYGLSERVSLHDFVPDVRPILRQLDLVVVPSLWEASSLVSMEAMAACVPVLGSDCPGLREVLRGTPSRTVATGDADALAFGLRMALEEPWADAARDYGPAARERFDSSRSISRLSELLGRVRFTRGW